MARRTLLYGSVLRLTIVTSTIAQAIAYHKDDCASFEEATTETSAGDPLRCVNILQIDVQLQSNSSVSYVPMRRVSTFTKSGVAGTENRRYTDVIKKNNLR